MRSLLCNNNVMAVPFDMGKNFSLMWQLIRGITMFRYKKHDMFFGFLLKTRFPVSVLCNLKCHLWIFGLIAISPANAREK